MVKELFINQNFSVQPAKKIHYQNEGISINEFYGTPLFALANNANVNGGTTLTKFEFAILQQQMKNLGFTFEEYGLDISSFDFEQKSAKATRDTISQAGSELQKAYKKQFGSKNGVSAAQTAETKADSVIKTALDMYKSEHADIMFTPKALGARPQFTEPHYKNNPTAYAMDLNDWANKVKAEYINAAKLSNEALTAMIIDNNNKNTAFLGSNLVALANTILQEVEDGTAEVLKTVNNAEGNIVKTIKSAEGHVVNVVLNSANRVIGVVKEESVKTRNTVRAVGADIINDNRFEHANTRGLIRDEAAATRNVVRDQSHTNLKITKRTAKETQEIEAMNIAISERVNVLNVTTAWPSFSVKIGNLQKEIAEANIPHKTKMELLQKIRDQISEFYTSDSELENLQNYIHKRIMKEKNKFNLEDIPPVPELPDYPSVPDYVEPVFETENENTNNYTPTTNPSLTKYECTTSSKEALAEKVNKYLNK